MNNSDERKIEYFIALCDDLITCKFLVAESKIQRLLIALADTQPIYELVSDCMEVFNREREMGKAFVTDGKGRFWCNMPTEEPKIIALVFCTLADIDEKKIDFTDFIKRFFDDEEGVNCYTSFARRMVLPFRELIAEAFGFSKRYSANANAAEEPKQTAKVEEKATYQENLPKFTRDQEQEMAEDVESDEDDDDDDDEKEGKVDFDGYFADIKKLVGNMLLEIDSEDRRDWHSEELKCLLSQINIACAEKNYQLVKALSIGVRYAGKGVKCVKFLLKEYNDLIEDFIDDVED